MACVTKGHICGPGGAISHIGGRAGNRDKLLKAGAAFSNFGGEMARLAGASEAVVDGFRKAGSGFGDARAVVGMFNTFEGTVNMIKTGRKFYVLAQGGVWNKSTDARDERNQAGAAERFWGALSAFADLVSWIFFNVIFGVVSPCSFIAKHTQASETTKLIGSQFGLLMLVRDSATAIHHIAEPIRGYHELKRREGEGVDTPKGRAELAEYSAKYYQECGRTFVRFIKDVADVAGGTIGVGGFSNVPKIAPLSLGFVSAVIGVVEIYWDVTS